MRIGIDVDGTLTNLQRFVFDRGTKFFNKSVVRTDCMQVRNTFDVSQEDEKAFWDENIFDYAANYKPLDYAREALMELHEAGHEIIIITARYHTYEYSELGNRMRKTVVNWFKDNDLYFDKIIFTHEGKKYRCRENKIDVMIEDKAANILAIADDRKVIAMDQPWNRKTEGDNIYRVYSWSEVVKKIEEISE